MVSNRANVAMIGEEDIKELVDEWEQVPRWVKAHVGARRPAHRYEGELLLDDGEIVFAGRDIKEGRPLRMAIPVEAITNVGIGFSEHLMASTDLAFGTGGPAPFVVSYQAGDREQTLYFSARADNSVAHMAVDNAAWYEVLDRVVARQDAGDGKARGRAIAWQETGRSVTCGCSSTWSASYRTTPTPA